MRSLRGGGGTYGLSSSVPRSGQPASSAFVSMMREKRTERGHGDPTELPALVREQPRSGTQPTSRTVSSSDVSLTPHGLLPPGVPAHDSGATEDPLSSLKPVSYTITDSTTRKELLGVVQQLQTALNDRTDSVNLIQRNFTRLSNLYRRDREELERTSEALRQLQQQVQQHSSDADVLAQCQLRLNTMESELRQAREDADHATHRLRVMEATHAAELASRDEAVQRARETLEDAQAAQAQAAEASAQNALDAQAREARWQAALVAARQESAVAAQEVQLLLQQVIVAVGELPWLSPMPVDESTEPTSSWPALREALQKAQDPLVDRIRTLRRQCVAASSQEERLEMVQAHAARGAQRQTLDAERADRARLVEAEEEQREQTWRIMQETGWRLHARLTAAQQEARAACESTEAALDQQRQLIAARAEQQEREHAQALHTLRTQLDDATRSAADSAGVASRLQQQLTESQSRIQAILADNNKLRADMEAVRQASVSTLHAERLVWERKHQETLLKLKTELDADRARELRAATEAHASSVESAYSAALRAQEAEWEDRLRLCVTALRAEASRAAIWQEMSYTIMESEQDERCHLTAEEASTREDLQRTLREMTVGERLALQQQQRSTRRYVEFAFLADEQRARADVVVAQAAAFASMSQAWWQSVVGEIQQRAARLDRRVTELETAVHVQRVAESQEAERDALRERLEHTEAERGRLEMLYTKLCGENSQLVQRAKAQKEAIHNFQDHAVSQQQVAVAALRRLQAAEEASESSYSCPICFQLFTLPVTCVPCGHTYCQACLEGHPRNRGRDAPVLRGGGAAGLVCPECGFSSVTSCVQTRALDQLAHNFQYRQQVLKEILHSLEAQAGETLPQVLSSSASSPLSQSRKSRLGSTNM